MKSDAILLTEQEIKFQFKEFLEADAPSLFKKIYLVEINRRKSEYFNFEGLDGLLLALRLSDSDEMIFNSNIKLLEFNVNQTLFEKLKYGRSTKTKLCFLKKFFTNRIKSCLLIL